jgi:hypothetical protein
MQMQIDREISSSNNAGDVYAGYEDYLRPLTADGMWDRSFEPNQLMNSCVRGGNADAFRKTLPNPLSGATDQDAYPSNKVPFDNVLDGGDTRQSEVEMVQGVPIYEIPWQGHSRHSFTLAGNRKIGISTNPCTASKVNLVSGNTAINPNKNVRKVYLNGISAEIISQDFVTGNIQVKVRFDDVDIENDVRWCADEIVLNPIPTSNNISLNVKTGKTIHLDQNLTSTRMDMPLVFNGQELFASNTLFRVTSGAVINMESASTFIVDNNSILRLGNGSQLDIGDGAVLLVKRGGSLEIEGGATINVMNGGKIIIEETPGIGSDGRLVYHPNARINLNGANSKLEIAGILDIQSNSVFTVSSAVSSSITFGSVKFNSVETPSQNVIAGPNSKFIIQSNVQGRKILYIEQESLYGPANLEEFSFKYGTAVMSDHARIVSPLNSNCIINFTGAKVTSHNDIRNTHRGLWLFGQPNITLQGSHFMNGKFGVRAYNTLFGSILNMSHCYFYNCDMGLFSYDKAVNALSTRWNNCDYGWYAEQMSLTSNAELCDAVENAIDGIFYQGVSVLNIIDSYINDNREGILTSQTTLRVNCGSISSNSNNGMHLKNASTLFLNGNPGLNHPPVTAVNNSITVYCDKANNIYSNLGYNDLEPATSNNQNVFNGTFLCQNYNIQAANFNNWNSSGSFGTSDYNITSCGNPVFFSDQAPVNPVLCGQAIPPCDPPCNIPSMDLLEDCSKCQVINTSTYNNVKLNEASKDAKVVSENDILTDNELLAIDRYFEILLLPLTNISEEESYILDYNYVRMKEAFSDAITKNQIEPSISPAQIDQYLLKLIEVQNRIISQATSNGQYDLKYFASMDKAMCFRMAGKLVDALSNFSDILTWCDPSDYNYVNRIQCLVQIELDLITNSLTIEHAESLMESCSSMPLRNGTTLTDNSKKHDANVFPNPANSILNVIGFDNSDCSIVIWNTQGGMVRKESFNNKLVMQIHDLSDGLYFYTIRNSNGYQKSGKFVIE